MPRYLRPHKGPAIRSSLHPASPKKLLVMDSRIYEILRGLLRPVHNPAFGGALHSAHEVPQVVFLSAATCVLKELTDAWI